jgi:hypothetical protein
MPDFPVRLWCSYVLSSGSGVPLYLEIGKTGGGGPPSLDSTIATIANKAFTDTLDTAFQFISRAIGWPIRDSFRINFAAIAPGAAPLPPEFTGDSHFGAVAIGLAQAVARAEPDCLRYTVRPLRPILESVRLDRVAVSAAYDKEVDGFKPVNCIANKLDSFFLPQLHARPAVCVVAMGQDLNMRCGGADDAGKRSDPAPNIPILRAYDPVDALLKLWEAQSKSLASVL